MLLGLFASLALCCVRKRPPGLPAGAKVDLSATPHSGLGLRRCATFVAMLTFV